MDTVDLVIKSATIFYNELRADSNGRYRSWEHCYKCFHDARNNSAPDLDYLSLQLAFYLASWGMYRGSSFLLQKDYKVHVPVVEELLKVHYNGLFGLECIELRKNDVQKKLTELNWFMIGLSSMLFKFHCSIKKQWTRDPTSGSGYLLINIGHSVAKYIGNKDNIKNYAQELKENTYNLTRMNLIMRGIKPDNIVTRNGDTRHGRGSAGLKRC